MNSPMSTKAWLPWTTLIYERRASLFIGHEHLVGRHSEAGGKGSETDRTLEEPADRHYARIRDQLEKQATPIGPNDLWIAAHASANSLTVVTANMSEFLRVPDLAVENWLL